MALGRGRARAFGENGKLYKIIGLSRAQHTHTHTELAGGGFGDGGGSGGGVDDDVGWRSAIVAASLQHLAADARTLCLPMRRNAERFGELLRVAAKRINIDEKDEAAAKIPTLGLSSVCARVCVRKSVCEHFSPYLFRRIYLLRYRILLLLYGYTRARATFERQGKRRRWRRRRQWRSAIASANVPGAQAIMGTATIISIPLLYRIVLNRKLCVRVESACVFVYFVPCTQRAHINSKTLCQYVHRVNSSSSTSTSTLCLLDKMRTGPVCLCAYAITQANE